MTAHIIALDDPLPLHENAPSKTALAGRVLTLIPALFLGSGAINSLLNASFVVQGVAHLGYPPNVVFVLGIVQLICVLLYLAPQTSIWGALLLTAYLGGATASHVRIGEPFFPPVLFAVIVWAGLALRDRRVVTLLFRSRPIHR